MFICKTLNIVCRWDMKPAGLIVFQSSPCLKYVLQPDGQALLTTQTALVLV